MGQQTILNQASAAVTASGSTGPLQVGTLTELEVNLNVTAVSGTTPSMTAFVEALDATGTWYTLWSPTAITAVGDSSQAIGAGLQTDVVVPETIRLRWAITGTTPSFTFSASIVARGTPTP